jgi:hypothetical protein
MLAACCIHNDMLALFYVGQSGRVKVVDFAYFGKSDTDNVCLHGDNYTVGYEEIRARVFTTIPPFCTSSAQLGCILGKY